MKTIRFDKGRRTIVYPSNWKMLSYEAPLDCGHVGVVTMQQRDEKIPLFIFFASKPIAQLSYKETEYIYALCEAESKEFEVVCEEQLNKVGMFEILEYLTYLVDEVVILPNDV